MKKTLTLVWLCCVGTFLYANNRYSIDEDNYHFGYVSLSGGYTSLSYMANDIKVSGSVGFLGGFGYEFRRHNFWLSAGLQVQDLRSKLTVNEYTLQTLEGGMDDLGRAVEWFRYKINQQDQQKWTTVDIPIIAGYYDHGFYIGAGLKVAFPVSTLGEVSGSYDISAKYDRYVGILGEDEGVHYYTNYDDRSKMKYNLRPSFSVVGEVGYDVLSSMMNNNYICQMLKIGLYFEYGIKSMEVSPALDPLIVNPNNITQATISPYFATEKGTKDWTVPYYIGLKITYLIGGSRNSTTTWHKGCQCYGY